MNKKTSSIAWWLIALVFTLSLATYQRMTGPTYPIKGNINIDDTEIKYELIRSSDSDKPAEILIENVNEGIEGELVYKRFKVKEDFRTIGFQRSGENMTAYLPPEPPAGKLEYKVKLFTSNQEYELSEEPVVIRFKGPVPLFVLIPHIIFMFLAMLLSTRTGIEVFRNGNQLLMYTGLTLILLLLGGMILGPIVQKYAFGDYWTGWPFGKDLTDNKTLVAFLAWIIAYLRIRKDQKNKWWAVAAAIILLAIYLIPHSMFGSELDYTSGDITTGE